MDALLGAVEGALTSVAFTGLAVGGGYILASLLPALSLTSATYLVGAGFTAYFANQTLDYVLTTDSPKEQLAGIVSLLFMLVPFGVGSWQLRSLSRPLSVPYGLDKGSPAIQFPEYPVNLASKTPRGFGELIGWGIGAGEAVARTRTITASELRQGGVTAKIAREWRDAYWRAVSLGEGTSPSNPTSPARAELMQRCVELLSPTPPVVVPFLPD